MFSKINHVAMASANYALVAKFYQVLFGLKLSENGRPESAVTVGDGYVGLNINPRRPGRAGGLDHFGFRVESVQAVRDDMQAMIDRNQALTPPGVGVGPEGKVRLRMFDETCPMGAFQLADMEGVLIDVAE